MGGNDNGWRGTIQRNLTVLADCTVVTSEMAALLLNYNLINRSEEHNLMNSTISDHDRAMLLYGKIAKKWNDEGFYNFTKALAECLNTRALEVLQKLKINQQPSVDIKSESSSAVNDACKRQLVKLQAQVEETRTMNLQLREELKLLTESLRAEFAAKVTNIEQIACSDVLSKANKVLEAPLAEFRADVLQLKHQMKVQDKKLEDLSALAEREKHLRVKKTADPALSLVNKAASEALKKD